MANTMLTTRPGLTNVTRAPVWTAMYPALPSGVDWETVWALTPSPPALRVRCVSRPPRRRVYLPNVPRTVNVVNWRRDDE